MTILPPDIIFEMMEKGFLDDSGHQSRPTENCPEKYKKAWEDWQKEFQETLKN